MPVKWTCFRLTPMALLLISATGAAASGLTPPGDVSPLGRQVVDSALTGQRFAEASATSFSHQPPTLFLAMEGGAPSPTAPRPVMGIGVEGGARPDLSSWSPAIQERAGVMEGAGHLVVRLENARLGRLTLGGGSLFQEAVKGEEDLSFQMLQSVRQALLPLDPEPAAFSSSAIESGFESGRSGFNGQPVEIDAAPVGAVPGLDFGPGLHFESPVVEGLRLSLGAEGDQMDFGLRYAASTGGPMAVVSLNVQRVGLDRFFQGDEGVYLGVAGLRFENGLDLSLAGAFGAGEASGNGHPVLHLARVGYRLRFFDAGPTRLSLERGSRAALEGGNAQALDPGSAGYGFQAIQSLEAWDADLFFGLRAQSHGRPGVDLDERMDGLFGARFEF